MRKGLGGDWPLGSVNISPKGEELHLSEAPCQTFLSTSCLFSGSKSGVQKAGKNSKGLSLGWGEPGEEAHLANWAMVYTDKKVGSLGVRGLHKLNKALLGKWIGVSQTK